MEPLTLTRIEKGFQERLGQFEEYALLNPYEEEMMQVIAELIESMLQGDVSSLSRLITIVENDLVNIPELIRKIYGHLGNAYHIGITGPPGSGKSSLITKLASLLRKEGGTIGVIACDPSSPISGGALLGDRIRMEPLFLDDKIFIRSMATRGNLGGLPRKVHAVAQILDSFGKDIVLIETVGVGQTEIDVRGIADTTILVFTPIVGDYIQAMKSGIIEVADIFVINKIDLGEASVIEENIASVLSMRIKPGNWKPPIIKVQATESIGIEDTLNAIKIHRQFLNETGLGSKHREQSRKQEFEQIMKEKLLKLVAECMERSKSYRAYLGRVEKGEINPYLACEEMLADKEGWDAVLSQVWKECEDPKL